MYAELTGKILSCIALLFFGGIISAIDIKRHIINPFSAYVYAALGMLYFFIYRRTYSDLLEVFSALVIIGIYLLILRKYIGAGDLKLMAILSLWFPLNTWIFGLLYTGAAALVYWLALRRSGRLGGRKGKERSRGSGSSGRIAFAPFIALGFLSSCLLDIAFAL